MVDGKFTQNSPPQRPSGNRRFCILIFLRNSKKMSFYYRISFNRNSPPPNKHKIRLFPFLSSGFWFLATIYYGYKFTMIRFGTSEVMVKFLVAPPRTLVVSYPYFSSLKAKSVLKRGVLLTLWKFFWGYSEDLKGSILGSFLSNYFFNFE